MKKTLIAMAMMTVVATGWVFSAPAVDKPQPGQKIYPMGKNAPTLKARLDLTDEQLNALEKLKGDQQKAQIRRKADIAVAQIELKDLLAAATVDEKAIQLKVKELNDLHAGGLKERVDSQLALRKILTLDQYKKLMALKAYQGQRGQGRQMKMRPMRGQRGPGFGPMGQRGMRPMANNQEGWGPEDEQPEPPEAAAE